MEVGCVKLELRGETGIREIGSTYMACKAIRLKEVICGKRLEGRDQGVGQRCGALLHLEGGRGGRTSEEN